MHTKTHHHRIVNASTNYYEWEESDLEPFEELIISWNTPRPDQGHYFFSVSLQMDEWSPYVDYALWGKEKQNSYHSTNRFIKSYQDIINTKKGAATGFKV